MNSPELTHAFVSTPDASFTLIGGPPIDDGDHWVLTNPGGEPLMRVPKTRCRFTTLEETAERLTEDARHHAEDRRRRNQ